MIKKLIRPNLQGIETYDSSSRKEKNYLQLDANENFHLDSPYSDYPEFQPKLLCERLATIYKTNINRLIVARGSDELLDLLVRTFCIPGKDSILLTSPTFSMYYQYALLNDVKILDVPLIEERESYNFNVSGLIETIKNEKPKLVFICTPNNPTGNSIAPVDLKLIIENSPQSIVVVDEAYIEYSDQPSFIPLTESYPNVVVLRTLSKYWAMAALRIGTLIASSETIKAIIPYVAPYSIPKAASDEAVKLLDKFSMINFKDDLQQQKRWVVKELSTIPDLKLFKSSGNFVFVKSENSSKLFSYLKEHMILVREIRGHHAIRISIGIARDNERLVTTIRDFYEQ